MHLRAVPEVWRACRVDVDRRSHLRADHAWRGDMASSEFGLPQLRRSSWGGVVIEQPARVPLTGDGWLSIVVEVDLAAVSDAEWELIAGLREQIRRRLANACPTCSFTSQPGNHNTGRPYCDDEYHAAGVRGEGDPTRKGGDGSHAVKAPSPPPPGGAE